MAGPLYALNLFNVADRDEYLAYSRRSAKEVQAHPAGVFFRASAFNVRTCSDVHARRFPFRLAIISPSGQSAAL
jgi:hypothetical protein